MSHTRAIETTYAGCRFRSRLEARWAVFFDALGMPWQYEPEAFALPSGNYLPDFYLPSINAWFEVKGVKPTNAECKLAYELAIELPTNVYIAYGDLPRPDDLDESGKPFEEARYGGAAVRDIWIDGGADCDYTWCVCTVCGKYGIQFEGRSARVCEHEGRGDKYPYTANDPSLLEAYEKARSYRFEPGASNNAVVPKPKVISGIDRLTAAFPSTWTSSLNQHTQEQRKHI